MATASVRPPEPVEPDVILILSLREATALFWNINPAAAAGSDDYDLLHGIEEALSDIDESISTNVPHWFAV